MRKNDAARSYVSGIKKLSAGDNPFADGDVTSHGEEKETKPVAYVRPRYGAYIAAAVLAVCVSVGAVFAVQHIRKDDTPADGLSSPSSLTVEKILPTEFHSVEEAVDAYSKASKMSAEFYAEFDTVLTSGNDADTIAKVSSEMLDKLYSLSLTCDSAVKYLKENVHYILPLSAYRTEGSQTVYLTVFNGLSHGVEFSGAGAVHKQGTGELYSGIEKSGTYTAEAGNVCEIALVTEDGLYGTLSVRLEEISRGINTVDLVFNFSEAVTSLPHERISELNWLISAQ